MGNCYSELFWGNFTANITGGTAPYTIHWSYGDGTTESNGSYAMSHEYSSTGSYSVSVIVTDFYGQMATSNCGVDIFEMRPSFIAPQVSSVNVPAYFTNTSNTVGISGGTYVYRWNVYKGSISSSNFQGGGNTDSSSPDWSSNLFTSPGTYYVTLDIQAGSSAPYQYSSIDTAEVLVQNGGLTINGLDNFVCVPYGTEPGDYLGNKDDAYLSINYTASPGVFLKHIKFSDQPFDPNQPVSASNNYYYMERDPSFLVESGQYVDVTSSPYHNLEDVVNAGSPMTFNRFMPYAFGFPEVYHPDDFTSESDRSITKTIYFACKGNNGGAYSEMEVDITIYDKLRAEIPEHKMCPGQELSLAINRIGGPSSVQYVWPYDNLTGANPVVSPTSNHNYVVNLVGTGSACYASYTIPVEVSNISISADALQQVCEGAESSSPIRIDVTGGSGSYQYDWSSTSLAFNNNTIEDPIVYGEEGVHSTKVTVWDIGNTYPQEQAYCSGEQTITVALNPNTPPTVLAGTSTFSVCPEEEVNLEGSAYGGGGSPYDYYWIEKVTSGSSVLANYGIVGEGDSLSIMPKDKQNRPSVYVLKVRDEKGCIAFDEVVINKKYDQPSHEITGVDDYCASSHPYLSATVDATPKFVYWWEDQSGSEVLSGPSGYVNRAPSGNNYYTTYNLMVNNSLTSCSWQLGEKELHLAGQPTHIPYAEVVDIVANNMHNGEAVGVDKNSCADNNLFLKVTVRDENLPRSQFYEPEYRWRIYKYNPNTGERTETYINGGAAGSGKYKYEVSFLIPYDEWSSLQYQTIVAEIQVSSDADGCIYNSDNTHMMCFQVPFIEWYKERLLGGMEFCNKVTNAVASTYPTFLGTTTVDQPFLDELWSDNIGYAFGHKFESNGVVNVTDQATHLRAEQLVELESGFEVDPLGNEVFTAYVYNSSYPYSICVFDANNKMVNQGGENQKGKGVKELDDIVTQEESAIKLYPNPTTGRLTIDLGEQKDEVRVMVINSLGQVVEQNTYNQSGKETIELNGEEGIYFVKIITTKQSSVYKIQKLKH